MKVQPQRHRFLFLGVWLCLAVSLLAGLLVVTVQAGPAAAVEPDWLEPRGLAAVELVGQVPDPVLEGAILSYNDGDGIVVYRAGRRLGNTIVVTTTLYPRVITVPWVPRAQLTQFGCLGQAPHFDHMGTVVPPSRLRVYDEEGEEVTGDIVFLTITTMGTAQPLADSTQPFRYARADYGPGRPNPLPLEGDGLHLPANSGCSIGIPGGEHLSLIGVFTLTLDPAVQAGVLGSQQATFHSYIGPGSMGIFQPLQDQLRRTYDDRHERILLDIPPGADYVLVKFPPMPGDPYTDCCTPPYPNADRPSAATYRFSDQTSSLSTDRVLSAAFPLDRAWQDADQVPGCEFLPTFGPLKDLAPPEYVLPAGVPYDACYTRGDCPAGILGQIYDAEMSLEIIYLEIDKVGPDDRWVPLRLAGPAWSPSVSGSPLAAEARTSSAIPASSILPYQIWLPVVLWPPQEAAYGWFDDLGRMLDTMPGR